MTNEELAALAKLGDHLAKEQLFANNQKFTHFMVVKFCTQKDERYEEFVSLANLGMVKAFNAFDPAKGYKFISFAALCIRNEILLSFRAAKKNRVMNNLEDSLYTDFEGNIVTLADVKSDGKDFTQTFENEVEANVIYELLERLTPTYKTIAMEHFVNGKTQKEVAKIIGLSQCYVNRVSKRIKQMFRNHRDFGVFNGTKFK